MTHNRLAIDRLIEEFETTAAEDAIQRVAEECARIADGVASSYFPAINLKGHSVAAAAIREQFRLEKKG